MPKLGVPRLLPLVMGWTISSPNRKLKVLFAQLLNPCLKCMHGDITAVHPPVPRGVIEVCSRPVVLTAADHITALRIGPIEILEVKVVV
jgi:hypothetical protein